MGARRSRAGSGGRCDHGRDDRERGRLPHAEATTRSLKLDPMLPLVRASARRPWLVVTAYAIVLAVAILGTLRLQHEDDVLVFLPEQDPDVQAFREISDRFGALRVALVGVEVSGEGDVLDATHLPEIVTASRDLAEADGVTRVTSLATVTDVVVAPEGVTVAPLVEAIPKTEAEHRALRDRVLSRELVAGTLVTPDARAAAILVYLRADVTTGAVVDQLHAITERDLPDFEVHLAGAPLAADAIYGEARSDVTMLSPIAGIALVLVVLLSFRDVVGVALTFFTVLVGVLLVLGGMGFVGEHYTVLTSTLPILLLATGSSYAVHVLGRYYLEREHDPPRTALLRGAAIVSRPVTIAALTTIAAFASFLVMDVRPMRMFGLEVALGTLVCWITAVTLIPAVVTLLPRAPQREQLLPFGDVLRELWVFTQRRRKRVLFVVGAISVLLSLPIGEVRVRTEAQAFLREGSPTWNATRFFEDRFGGARYVQIEVEGDFAEPSHLRELARLVDRARAQPRVTQVTSLVGPLALTIDLLGGGRRLPSTRAQAEKAYLFLDGEGDFTNLLNADHDRALVHVRVRGDAEPVVEALERWLEEDFREHPQAPSAEDAVQRLAWIGEGRGANVDATALGAMVQGIALPRDDDPRWRAARAEAVAAFLAGEDAADLDAAVLEGLRATAKGGGDVRTEILARVTPRDDAEYYVEVLDRALTDARHRYAVEHGIDAALAALGLADTARDDPGLRHELSVVVQDRLLDDIAAPTGELHARMTGEPVVDRALSRSVARNQGRTMVVGLIIVLLLLVALFRSWQLALACLVPAVLTATVLGGIMGMFGVQIDLSTAMVGAILTDTGSDFGMHYLWYLQRDEPSEVTRTVGPILIVSNLLVAAGFLVFALGHSPVMHLFGTLSGATCVVSAVLACVLVPALWRASWSIRGSTLNGSRKRCGGHSRPAATPLPTRSTADGGTRLGGRRAVLPRRPQRAMLTAAWASHSSTMSSRTTCSGGASFEPSISSWRSERSRGASSCSRERSPSRPTGRCSCSPATTVRSPSASPRPTPTCERVW